MPDTTNVTVSIPVPFDRITNALVGALEGPYSPWMHSFRHVSTEPSVQLAALARGGEHTVWYNDPSFWHGGGAAEAIYDLATDPEGAGSGKLRVSKAELLVGLEMMAKHSPRHFADLLNENDDAETHDVFMQMVVFGEIIYG